MNGALVQNGWPTDNITFLRTIPAMEFVTKMQWAFRAVDGMVITADPDALFSDPTTSLNAKAVINGFNSMDDFMPWMNEATPTTDRAYKRTLEKAVQNEVCF